MSEKIDELRHLVGAHDRRCVSMHAFSGTFETTTTDIVRTFADSGDRAYVFLGPKEKLHGQRTVEDDGTVVFTLRIPPDS